MNEPSLTLLVARATILEKLEQVGIKVVPASNEDVTPVGTFGFSHEPFAFAAKRAPKLSIGERSGLIYANCQYPNNNDMRIRSHVRSEDLADACRMLAEGLAEWHTMLRASLKQARFQISRRDRARSAFPGSADEWRHSSVTCIPQGGAEDTAWAVNSSAAVGWSLAAYVPTAEMYRMRGAVRDLRYHGDDLNDRYSPAGRFNAEIRWAESLLSQAVPALPVIAKRFPGIRRMFEAVAKL